jgi:hypothetical protein
VRAGEAAIAVGGSWGTLSEIALARKMGRMVVTLGRPPVAGLGLPAARDPDHAVALALEAARAGRPAVGKLPTEEGEPSDLPALPYT